MPVIGNNVHTLLDGLSDFWTRFWADVDELKAFYQGSELLMAQAYLDLLSSFLNISVTETPLFNKENFKLVLAREDNIVYREGTTPMDDRHVLDLVDSIVKADVLQNKVANPTASMERMESYDLDATAFELLFYSDPAGTPLRLLSTTFVGELLTYGPALTRFYVTDDSKPFAEAEPGYWLQLSNSGSGNDATYYIERVIDDNTVALTGSFTLPDANSGSLEGRLLNTEFLPVDGFAQRRTLVTTGGSFDDPTRRAALERDSWFAPLPVGLDVKKGDILRVLDREVLPTVPYDYDISLVRNNRLYLNANDPLEISASDVDYVVLRRPWNAEQEEKQILFTQEDIRPAKTNTDGVITTISSQIRFTSASAPFTSTDKARYVTLSGCGPITWQADLSSDGRLTWNVASTIQNPLARAFTGSRIVYDGVTYTVLELIDSQTCYLSGSEFTPLTNRTAVLQGITNDGTYRIKDVINTTDILLDLEACTPEPNNGSVTWVVHDGYRADLQHSRLIKDTLVLRSTVGNMYTGGSRAPVKNVDYTVDLEKGQVIQIGRLAGTWGTNPLTKPNVDYEWLKELPAPTVLMDLPIPGTGTDSIDATNRIITFDQATVEAALAETAGFTSLFHEGTLLRISNASDPINNLDYTIQYVINSYTVKVLESPNSSATENFMNGTTDGVYASTLRGLSGVLDENDNTALVTEVALWAPDVHVDKFHLYNNYGYLLNRFQASSEAYRGFIRGVFQLYILGPALERIEAALNVIAGYAVIRDEGEQLVEYITSDPNENVVITVRPNADQGEYRYPKTVPIRDDVVNYVPGTSAAITFEAFEPLTELFIVTDYVQDPTWWESIVIPPTLMPNESTNRRTTFPVLYENVIGAPDNPKIGDPGLFIGADDEGVVPFWAEDLQPVTLPFVPIAPNAGDLITKATNTIRLINGAFTAANEGQFIRLSNSSQGNNNDYKIVTVLSSTDAVVYPPPAADETWGFMNGTSDGLYFEDTTPAKRRKMANVVMNTWIKYHMFYVRFDSVVNSLVTPEFLNDLRELIIIAKPGWKILYIEPASDFLDVIRLTESPLEIQTTVQFLDAMTLGDQGLTIQSASWDIGNVFRHNAAVLAAALFTADGSSVPPPVVLANNIVAKRVKGPAAVPPAVFPQEYVDYDFDYKTGTITPTTIWPAGVYTMEYASVTMTAYGSKNPAVGDTDLIIGGNDPKKPFVTRELDTGGIFQLSGSNAHVFRAVGFDFEDIHIGQDLALHTGVNAGRHRIRGIIDGQAVIEPIVGVVDTGTIVWSFPSDEPSDGTLTLVGGLWHFVSPQAMFRQKHIGRYVRIFSPSNPENAGPHGIDAVLSMAEVVLINPSPSFVAESNLHWQMQSAPDSTDFLERPLEIRVY